MFTVPEQLLGSKEARPSQKVEFEALKKKEEEVDQLQKKIQVHEVTHDYNIIDVCLCCLCISITLSYRRYPARVCASGVKRLLLSVCLSVNNIEIPFKHVT